MEQEISLYSYVTLSGFLRISHNSFPIMCSFFLPFFFPAVSNIILILHSPMWYSNLELTLIMCYCFFIFFLNFLLTLLTAPVYALMSLTACDTIQNMLVPCTWFGIVVCSTLLHLFAALQCLPESFLLWKKNGFLKAVPFTVEIRFLNSWLLRKKLQAPWK